MILFNPKTTDGARVQKQYLENIGHKKGYPSGSKLKENQETSKEGKMKWEGKAKKTTSTTHQRKDLKTIVIIIVTLTYTLKKCVGNWI